MERPDRILLSLKNLSVGFRRPSAKPTALFEDLNLELSAGQLVCLMGPNGIGKSSLIRTIAGLQQPLAGGVWFPSAVASRSTQLAVVLTDRITNVNLTAYELVSLGRYPYLDWSISLSAADRQQIDSAISRVRVDHLAAKKLFELSDGQLQMVMIARALAQDTPLILLDEPTAHLDLNNRVETMRLLKSLTRTTGKAILVSTHELDLALQLADVIWLTDRNQKIRTGAPEDLVLDGSFDNIFQFKGFDLKTGKIEHSVTTDVKIHLEGTGFEYLWTKNALERSGFEIVTDGSENRVRIIQSSPLQWSLQLKDREPRSFLRLGALLNHLHQTIAYSHE